MKTNRGRPRPGLALRRQLATLSLALCAVGASNAVLAQAPAPLTLPQAFEQAWARQPEAQAQPLRREAAEAQLRAAQAWTAAPPALDLALKSDRLQDSKSRQGAREQQIGLSAPLWLPGERAGAQDLARAGLAALDSRQLAAQWRLAGALREAWWALWLAREESLLARARVEHAAQLAADVTRRQRAGELARADQHQAEGALAAAQAAAAQIQAGESQALQALRAATGLAAPELARLGADPEPEAGGTPEPGHPALRELADRAELARRARALAERQGRANPELSLMASRERGAFGEPYGQALTLGVRLPFGGDARARANQASAGAELAEAEQQLRLEQERLAIAAETAQAQVDAARQASVAAARRAALAEATQGFHDKAFRLGETDLPTRLRLAQEAFEAQRDAARARIALAQAISQQRQTLGLLP